VQRYALFAFLLSMGGKHCYYSQNIINHIPWAQLVQEGSQLGQVPTLQFGHLWYEYFDSQVWHDVLHVFMQSVPQ